MSKENVVFPSSSCMWQNVCDTEALQGASVQNRLWSCWMLAAAFPHRGWPVGSGAPSLSGSLNSLVFLTMSLQDGGELAGSGWGSQLTGLEMHQSGLGEAGWLCRSWLCFSRVLSSGRRATDKGLCSSVLGSAH